MTYYIGLLERMMQNILTGDTIGAESIYREKPEFSAQEHINVYIRGYRFRLHKIIAHLYPATASYLGKEAFKKQVDHYITASPSSHFAIDSYAIAFGPYLAALTSDLFLGELAVWESVMHETWHQAETRPLTHEWLKKHPPEALTHTPLKLRTASRLLAFSYPVSDWMGRLETAPKPEQTPSFYLVVRHNNLTQCLSLEKPEYILLTLVAKGQTLGEALGSELFAAYTHEHTALDFQRWFARWIDQGIFQLPA